MTKYKMLNGIKTKLMMEETMIDADAKAWNDALNRRMTELRRQRDVLLAETDWIMSKLEKAMLMCHQLGRHTDKHLEI